MCLVSASARAAATCATAVPLACQRVRSTGNCRPHTPHYRAQSLSGVPAAHALRRYQRAFSTTYMERGDHTGKDGTSEELESSTLRADIDESKTTQLVRDDERSAVWATFSSMAPMGELPIFDLHHRRRSIPVLVSMAHAFAENVRWWTARYASALPPSQQDGIVKEYSALLELWTGMHTTSPAGRDGNHARLAEGAAEGAVEGAGGAPVVLNDGQPAASATGTVADRCILDQLMELSGMSAGMVGGVARVGMADEVRYLVYQPPGGLGEWLIALRNALGVARALNRTLVIPPLLVKGPTDALIRFSSAYDMSELHEGPVPVIEFDDFARIGLTPSRLVLLHVKDSRTLPARTFFDEHAGWGNANAVHTSAQMATAADYVRLYGQCGDHVLAISNLYAAFEGFVPLAPGAVSTGVPVGQSRARQAWWQALANSLPIDKHAVKQASETLVRLLRKPTGQFSCVHLADLDVAAISSQPGGGRWAVADLWQPAAQSVPFSAHLLECDELEVDNSSGSPVQLPVTMCDAYDAEAQSRNVGRQWVQQLYDEGIACETPNSVVAANLPRLPQGNPVFVVSDSGHALPSRLAAAVSETIRVSFNNLTSLSAHLTDRAALRTIASIAANPALRTALEHRVCTDANALLVNGYSPISRALERRAVAVASKAKRRPPSRVYWTRQDSDVCVPLFTRTARFDILPNRFGILGQFGPDRKLQLLSTNLTSIVGWSGRIMPNASIELEVFASNASHGLHIFEYTKENNAKGIQFTIPAPKPSGWRPSTWHSFSIPLHESYYSQAASTPWHNMDRLELYYASPSPNQPRGDIIRLRNVYVRSTSSFKARRAGNVKRDTRPCSEINLVDRITQYQENTRSGYGARLAAQQAKRIHDSDTSDGQSPPRTADEGTARSAVVGVRSSGSPVARSQLHKRAPPLSNSTRLACGLLIVYAAMSVFCGPRRFAWPTAKRNVASAAQRNRAA